MERFSCYASPIPFAPLQLDKQESCCFRGTELADEVRNHVYTGDSLDRSVFCLCVLHCTTRSTNENMEDMCLPRLSISIHESADQSLLFITKKWFKTRK